MMPWALKAIMDAISTILLVVAGLLHAKDPTSAALIGAVAVGLKAFAEYLYEKGIIVQLRKR